MPSLEIRGRYVLREYWSDSDLFRKLTAAQREIYVGLWMLADDKGWLPRDVPEIAAALYRFEDSKPREARVKEAVATLIRLKKVAAHRCGCLEIAAVRRYPRPGNKSSVHIDSHRARHTQTPSTSLDDVQTSSIPSPNPTLPKHNSTNPASASAGAHARGGEVKSAKEILDEAWKR